MTESFGKAALGMAIGVEKVLSRHLVKGVISIPKGSRKHLEENAGMYLTNSQIEVIEGALHNLPDEEAENASRKMQHMIKGMQETDILVVLISGGGSSLLPAPISFISLKEKNIIIEKLSKRGAAIHELNCVRKKLSTLKGGGLAKLAFPRLVIALILSDVINDSLEIIASGPTVPDNGKISEALEVLGKYGVYGELSDRLKKHFVEAVDKEAICKFDFSHVTNVLIGNNRSALEGALKKAAESDMECAILTDTLRGEARDVGRLLVKLCELFSECLSNGSSRTDLEMFSGMSSFGITLSKLDHVVEKLLSARCTGKPMCVVLGGETVVTVRGSGKGGRNQELILAAAIEFQTIKRPPFEFVILSGGSDGIDGDTNAAGAVTYVSQIASAEKCGLNAIGYLNSNDSHTFYSLVNGGADLLQVGHTGTNVMDVVLIVVVEKGSQV